MTALAGLVVAALLWWLLKVFTRSKPAQVATILKRVGGVLALVAAGFLLLRGRFDMAALAGGAAAWLFGWSGMPRIGRFGGPKQPGSVSRVRSATVEMELDHDSGRMDGTILAGPQAGARLADLDLPTLVGLRASSLGGDLEGVRLLEAYLDRRFPAWREDAQADGDRGRRPDPEGGPMTQQEAYEILGLQPGEPDEAIRAAHRTLMKKLHPDQGGSTYLASRVNQAKDVLLNRHR